MYNVEEDNVIKTMKEINEEREEYNRLAEEVRKNCLTTLKLSNAAIVISILSIGLSICKIVFRILGKI